MNVFDFLVDDDTPNGSRASLLPPADPVPSPSAPPPSAGPQVVAVLEPPHPLREVVGRNESRETLGESRYAENGYHYGEGPVPVLQEPRYTYLTPAPHHPHPYGPDRTRYRHDDAAAGRGHPKDRKRKRVQLEDLQLITTTQPPARPAEADAIMTDAPPILHSGLTGGLKGLLARTSDYPPSPDYSSGADARGEASPGSPLKRSKRHLTRTMPITTLISTRRRSAADGPHRLTKHSPLQPAHRRPHRTRAHHHHDDAPAGERAGSRKLKTIKYRPERESRETHEGGGGGAANQQQLVLYRGRVDLFMSFITKGPESEKGCSMNKVLKRYHRERSGGGGGGGVGRMEEEKELWKSLRVRRNERGEIVLFSPAQEDVVMN